MSSPRTLRIGANIAENDLYVKAATVKRMLKKGKAVRIQIMFKGREAEHSELSLAKLKTVWEEIEDVAVMSVKPTIRGRELFMEVRSK